MSLNSPVPTWDLTPLYASREDPKIEADFLQIEQQAATLRKDCHGKVAKMPLPALGQALEDYEVLSERLSLVMSFADLCYAAHTDDPEVGRFYQEAQARATEIDSKVLFFSLELAQAYNPERWNIEPKLRKYAPWLAELALAQKYFLPEVQEQLCNDLQLSGRSAFQRLFDETMVGLRFPLGKKKLTCSEVLHLFTSPREDQRKAASESVGKTLQENAGLFSLILNTLGKDKATQDKWRKFPNPVRSRNLHNQVEDEVVETLVQTVRGSYKGLSHRYYALKAQWMGDKKLDYWNRNAPIPGSPTRKIPWERAKEITLQAYREFSPQVAEIVEGFFDENRIDAQLRPGKSSGAFCHPVSTAAKPYVLMNYHGSLRDIATLAHELGHGVHQTLAEKQGFFLSGTPLTLAEMASVFGEILVFHSLQREAKTPKEKRALLAAKVEDMLNTVVRQVSMHDFELAFHTRRKSGELTPKEICQLWVDTQKKSLGPAVRLRAEYQYYWAYIPHFIHTPFYVYAYAFGECLTHALYAKYQERGEAFIEQYLEVLSAGGSKRHGELLAPFGLDARKPEFWQYGMRAISKMIDQLETMG